MNSLSTEEDDPDNLLRTISNEGREIVEKQFGDPRWSQLPALVVEKIYTFLNRRDQESMSLVCRNWREEFSSPILWRRMKFCLPDVENQTELCPGVIFARKYGTMFHHVDIIFSEKDYEKMSHKNCERNNEVDVEEYSTYFLPSPATIVSTQLKFFMQSVTVRSELLSISFKNMFQCFYKMDVVDYEDVYQAILNLIRSQKKLQCISFDHCLFSEDEAEEILGVIFEYSSPTLRHLHLEEFILEPLYTELANPMLDDELHFRVMMNLKSLRIDYSLLFEKLMISFYEYRNRADMRGRKGHLEEMNLICTDYGAVYYTGIHPSVWNYFRKVFPKLRLSLRYRSKYDPMGFSTILVPEMPLRELNFRLHYNLAWPDQEVGELLRRITFCDINKFLEVLKINWMAASPNFAPDLMSFTKVCLKLKTLELEIAHPALGLDILFNCWLDNRPESLRVVKITMPPPRGEEKMIFSHLYNTFAPLLQPLEIEFIGITMF